MTPTDAEREAEELLRALVSEIFKDDLDMVTTALLQAEKRGREQFKQDLLRILKGEK